jgi:hypothetical protein
VTVAGAAALLIAASCTSTGEPKPEPSPQVVAEAARLSQLALDRWLENEVRLQRISQRVRLAGAEFCGDEVSPVMGFAAAGRESESVPRLLTKAIESRYPDERFRVLEVFPGMAAETGGVRAGDVLLAIGRSRVGSQLSVYRPTDIEQGAIALRVSREGQEFELRIPNIPGCAYPAELFPADSPGAFSIPRRRMTYLPTGLLRAIDSDEQIALVVGHEIAHLIIARVERRFLDSYETENQADYIGAYLAVRGGFVLDPEDATLFDVIMLGDVRTIDRLSPTHPVTPARTFALRETLLEIDEKRRSGAALVPAEKNRLSR